MLHVWRWSAGSRLVRPPLLFCRPPPPVPPPIARERGSTPGPGPRTSPPAACPGPPPLGPSHTLSNVKVGKCFRCPTHVTEHTGSLGRSCLPTQPARLLNCPSIPPEIGDSSKQGGEMGRFPPPRRGKREEVAYKGWGGGAGEVTMASGAPNGCFGTAGRTPDRSLQTCILVRFCNDPMGIPGLSPSRIRDRIQRPEKHAFVQRPKSVPSPAPRGPTPPTDPTDPGGPSGGPAAVGGVPVPGVPQRRGGAQGPPP